MKHILATAAVLALSGIAACTNVEQPADRPAEKPAAVAPVPAPGTPAPAVDPAGGANAAPTVAAPGVTSPRTATPSTATPSTGAPQIAPIQGSTPAQTAALNPAHGMPGHTCAIPVGAPLSSAPPSGGKAPAAPNVSVQTSPQAPISLGSGSSGGARLNPAHGMPGHTCAIPVGQPLP